MAIQSLNNKSQIDNLRRIKKLEEELQDIKWDISISPRQKGVVESSAGILGSKFEEGVIYQRKIRKEWEKRLKKMNL